MNILPPPGPARTRQLILLGVLLIAAAYAISRLRTEAPADSPVPASNPQTPPAPVAGNASTRPQPLALEKLEPVPDAPETKRNPFRFGTRPAPPAPPRPAYVPPAPGASPPAPPSVPGVAPISLKFIGRVVLPDQSVVAVLSDVRGNVLEGMEGQVIDGRYRIVRIGQESLIVEYVDGAGRTTLQLRGS
jgi:hypothetical protein